jgi:glucose/arabinose dehydrogenase
MAITGNAGANRLNGTARSNDISGLGGNDSIFGKSGADTATGGTGNDRISGGEGSDRLNGGGGNDVIFGFGASDRNAASGNITVTPINSTTFDRPIYATAAPGDPGRLYVVEQHTGRILILDISTGAVKAQPFLDIPGSQLATGNEQGLLGLAFHPDYASNGRFYVYLTRSDGDVEVRAYQRSTSDPDMADPGSGDVILRIDKDNGAGNHNGGWMDFGPDGMLFIAVGDEGLGGDPANNAQNRNVLWGKMLRIDVNGDDFAGNPTRDYTIPDDNPFVGIAGADEIWALGLRNPWRASFDEATGNLYIGDVGQDRFEEINVHLSEGAGGSNYGWKVKEGRQVFDDGVAGNPAPGSPQLTDPVVQYGHNPNGGFAVVGGYVYHGPSPGMHGRYLYADFVTGHLWSFRLVGSRAVDVTRHTEQLTGSSLASVASFAETGNGSLYVIGLDGSVSRLDFGASSGDSGDVIDGGAGRDRLYGGAGNDTVTGGSGNDRIEGGGQNDSLNGGGGADTILGGAGNDTMAGGAGADSLNGNAGRDTFVFGTSSQSDTITDFSDDVDAIRLSDAFGFANASQALAVAVESGANVVFNFSGGQTLTILDATKAQLENDLLV